MRILFVSSSSGSRGGGELYLSYLGSALKARNHEVALWTSTHPRMDELSKQFSEIGEVLRDPYSNTYDYRLRSLATCFNSRRIRRIVPNWEMHQADVIHFNKQNLEDGLDLLRMTGRLSCPSVCTIHLTQSAGYLRARFSKLRDYLARRELRAYRGTFVVIQEPRAAELRALLGERACVRVIPNSVPLPTREQLKGWRSESRAKLGFDSEDVFLVLALGRMEAQKRPLLFLETARRMHERIPKARFVWIGDGRLAESWDIRVDELGLGGIVRRISWQSKVFPLLAAGDLFLHVAEYESFLPLALLEAMSAILPCAVTANLVNDIDYFNTCPELCIVVKDGWESVVSNADALRALAGNGRKAVEKDFSLERMGMRYEALYRSSVGKR